MRQLDRWRRDGHRSSRFFLCTPVLGAKRRKIQTKVDIDIETRMPAAVEELRRWTSAEALGDITVNTDCTSRIVPNVTLSDGEATDGTIVSDDEGIDHKLPSPEEQLQVVALKFPAEIVAVDVSGKSFDRMSAQRRSLLYGAELNLRTEGDSSTIKRKSRVRRPRSRRRNTLAGTDQKEIQDALTAGEEPSSLVINNETESARIGAVCRSKSSDILRTSSKKESSEIKKSHFSTLKQWGKNRYDKFMNKSSESKNENAKKDESEVINIYETITLKRKRSIDRERKKTHERSASVSSSEKSNASMPIATPLSSVMNIAVKLRENSLPRRRRSGGKDEPHSSSGNWSASSESGRASVASESTTTTHPKSTTSNATSNNSLNLQLPSSVNSRRRFNLNVSTSGSCTSEGTLTPDIIHDLQEDGETSSVYSCDTEGYYTSFHMDSGLKTLKEEDMPSTPLHSTSAFSNSSSNNTILTAENEYELFGKGSTSTTTSSAGTVCTTLKAADSNKSLVIGPAVPERKSSLSKVSNKDTSREGSLEHNFSSDKTGTVKRSPPTNSKARVVAVIHKQNICNNNNSSKGDVSPDSGHNTSSSPIESINSPNGVRSGSEFEFSESSDMEGPERIERIRVKTTINSSRIPSMCVITPPHSDDESITSYSPQIIGDVPDFSVGSKNGLGCKSTDKSKINLSVRSQDKSTLCERNKENVMNLTRNINTSGKIQVVNVNPLSGYATVEVFGAENCDINKNTTKMPLTNSEIKHENIIQAAKTLRAPSPSGGTVTIKEEITSKSPQTQPLFKASLMPLNNMFGKIKLNIANLRSRRESKSPCKEEDVPDSGEYVTIADVRNNNETIMPKTEEILYANDIVNKNLKTVLTGKLRETEYISLNELPCSEPAEGTIDISADSLERRRRQGARVTLDAEGKVMYMSDSLKRRKGAHTTFEPGPFVKPTESPNPSPLPRLRILKAVKPVKQDKSLTVPNVDSSRPMSPQFGKIVIKATPGSTTPVSEVVRMPPSTIVSPSTRPMSPKPLATKGAYVHMQDTGKPLSPAQNKGKIQKRPNTPKPHTKYSQNKHTLNLFNTRKINRNESYRMANSGLKFAKPAKGTYRAQGGHTFEDEIEKEIAEELWRERINYPSTVSPKLCNRHFYSQSHAQEMLLASPKRVIIPPDSEHHRARVLSASIADTEIW